MGEVSWEKVRRRAQERRKAALRREFVDAVKSGELDFGEIVENTGPPGTRRRDAAGDAPVRPRGEGTPGSSGDGGAAVAVPAVSVGDHRRGEPVRVRLRADEAEALHEVMRTLDLASPSEALRAGLRLLVREAAERSAAEEVRRHYGDLPAPLPDGVSAPTEEELRAADDVTW
ncbi:hypothetical protein [Streptomyces sp. NPDC049879]|uniref:hypothetical protein n=1 Tax=Streptomyces sp. NPDC049879 TaxID=3365598 RepID=UPI0037A00C33